MDGGKIVEGMICADVQNLNISMLNSFAYHLRVEKAEVGGFRFGEQESKNGQI